MPKSKPKSKQAALHMNNSARVALCRPYFSSMLVLTTRPDRVTCKHCRGQLTILHFLVQGNTAQCGKTYPALMLTDKAADVTCLDCLHAAAPEKPDRTLFVGTEVCFRHYGGAYDLTACCGACEAGWARTSLWNKVTCPACKHLR